MKPNDENNNAFKHSMVKNQRWQKANQLATVLQALLRS